MQKLFYFLIFCLSPLTIWSQSETERSLSFYNTHTYERLTVIYKKGDAYIQEALGKINTILRDHRTGDIQPIAQPVVVPTLCEVTPDGSNQFSVRLPQHG